MSTDPYQDEPPREPDYLRALPAESGPSGFERQQPQDLFAEQATLGAALLSTNAIGDISETLRADDFYRPAHQMVWDAILHLYGNGEPADAITVANLLVRRGELDRVGGATYLHTLVATVPTAASGPYYARIVADKAKLRGLVETGTKIAQSGYEGGDDADVLINLAQQHVYRLGEKGVRTDVVPFGTGFTEAMEHFEAIEKGGVSTVGVPTGFRDLDDLTNGFQPGQLVIVAARPAIGKSVFGTDVARSAAFRHNMCTAIFSLEMSRLELSTRIISAESGVKLQNLRMGPMTDNDWRNVVAAMDAADRVPLFIDDSPHMTIPEIRAKCRRLKQLNDLKLVVIDYLQLMSSGHRAESRQQEVSEFSRALKLLAKELEVPVVAISQLNRGPEQRADKKPMMSDLRESGSIEQDGDVVILLHREDAYDKDVRPGEADFIVAKHRNGPTGVIPVVFRGHYTRFDDMARM